MRKVIWAVVVSGCAMQDNALLVDDIVRNGFTCDVKHDIASMSEDDRTGLREDLLRVMSRDDLLAKVDQAPSCPGAVITAVAEEGNVAGTWKGVAIPKVIGGAGLQATTVYRDGINLGWMCDPHNKAEVPADYVAQFHVPGAFANSGHLKVHSRNVWSACYLGNPSSTRVYQDDDLRMCIGWWHVFACGGLTALPGDIGVSIQ